MTDFDVTSGIPFAKTAAPGFAPCIKRKLNHAPPLLLISPPPRSKQNLQYEESAAKKRPHEGGQEKLHSTRTDALRAAQIQKPNKAQ